MIPSVDKNLKKQEKINDKLEKNIEKNLLNKEEETYSFECPNKNLYVKGMKTQKLQFEALEKAIYRYMDYMGLTDKVRNKIIKKIETRKSKIQ
jgi:hypothetical protein